MANMQVRSGNRAVTAVTAAKSVTVAICTGYDVKSGRPCGRPAAADVLAGCVHEHIGWRLLCDWHAGDVAAGMMLCGNCGERGCPGCVLMLLDRRAAAGGGR